MATTKGKHTSDDTIASPVLRTEAANAKRFIDANCDKLRFVPAWRKWLAWDGRRWKLDPAQVVVKRLAMRWTQQLWLDYGRTRITLTQRDASSAESFCKQSNSSAGITAMVTLAQSDPRVIVEHEALDTKSLLFNVLNGTIDLSTGQLRDHCQDDLLTQLAPVEYDADATCPKWISTMELVFAGDTELIEYIQTMLGYALSGLTGEHFLSVWWGKGRNGKSTIWQTIASIMGDDYAIPAADSLLLGDGDGHPTDVADLFRKRFVIVSEPEQNAKLKEAKVKKLTGDSMLKARRMKEDFWTFPRTHKTFMATNHKPKIVGVDDGIWRRVKLIPFTQNLSKVTSEIKDYDAHLVSTESIGILNWLLDGWRRYQQHGLVDPQVVVSATKEYQGESDPMRAWIDTECVIGGDEIMLAAEGYQSFKQWQIGSGVNEDHLWTQAYFAKQLADRFTKDIPSSGYYRKKTIYIGIRLKTDDEKRDDAKSTDESKSQEKLELPTVAQGLPVTPMESASLGANQTTMGNHGQIASGGQSGGAYDIEF